MKKDLVCSASDIWTHWIMHAPHQPDAALCVTNGSSQEPLALQWDRNSLGRQRGFCHFDLWLLLKSRLHHLRLGSPST